MSQKFFSPIFMKITIYRIFSKERPGDYKIFMNLRDGGALIREGR